MLHISKGNTKLGGIPNVSLTPGSSCPGCQGACYKRCYARRCEARRPAVKAAWAENYELAKTSAIGYFGGLRKFLDKRKPKYFRIHVGGDFFSAVYFAIWRRFAEEFPNTRFMAFTKSWRDDVIAATMARGPMPKNFKVIASMWPGVTDTTHGLPRAWFLDPKCPDPRIPKTAFLCPGSCTTCKYCWHMRKNQSVQFTAH